MPCFMLVEVSVQMQCFVSIRTNFVKNIKPSTHSLASSAESCNYVKIRICTDQCCYLLVSVATALRTEPYILPLFIAATFCLYLQQYSDIHSSRLPVTNILCKDICLGNVSGYLIYSNFLLQQLDLLCGQWNTL
jgi:hypothetical protein